MMRFVWKNAALALLIMFLTVLVVSQSCRRAARRVAGDFYYPFLAYPSKTESAVGEESMLLLSKRTLVDKLTRRRRDNLKLSAKVAIQESLRLENAELRRMMKLPARGGYENIFAEIYLRDPAFWDERFSIDKGADDGVKPGSVVLAAAERGLAVVVGRVSETGRHHAVVDTLLSPHCRLGVMLPDNGAFGVTTGGERGSHGVGIRVSYLPKDLSYMVGGEAVTSGLSGRTPTGLKVGVMKLDGLSVVRLENGIYAEGILTPAADFDRLRFVMVMVRQ